jgi:putative heme-binding domain-containing protein
MGPSRFTITFSVAVAMLTATVFLRAADDLPKVPTGFKIEKVYEVPRDQQGSWICMTSDDKGRLIVSAEKGGLYRITPAPIGQDASQTKVEKLTGPFGSAHGLLVAHNSLYVVVAGKSPGGQTSGLYRLTDTNGNDQYDKAVVLKKFKGQAGHGPHAVVKSPDGKGVLCIGGNHVDVPEGIGNYLAPKAWSEDLLLPRMWDARGHARGKLAPGGWVTRCDADGKNWTLIATGFRNAFDLAINTDGQIFTFDADMEWDMGTPWYRPTRICHVVSGAEFGWRSGTGKWPAYFPDSVGAVVNVGAGSPTGMTFGYKAIFPKKYQGALFVCDWSYGNIYAVHLQVQGGSYTGTVERFVSHQPLAVCDITVNPKDGAMYFVTGGRNARSTLYRVTHPAHAALPVPPSKPAIRRPRIVHPPIRARMDLERAHANPDPTHLDIAWPSLSHADRSIRYAARIAIEQQPVASWAERALAEKNPIASIQSLIALARHGDKTLRPKSLAALNRIDISKLKTNDQLALLRAYSLTMIRLGQPSADETKIILKRFEPMFPSESVELNYELARLLIYLESSTSLGKILNQLETADSQEEQIFYALHLRKSKAGWDPARRKRYFQWFHGRATQFPGGNSFAGFLKHIQSEAVATLSGDQKKALGSLVHPPPPQKLVFKPKARPFVKAWTVKELTPLVETALKSGKSKATRGRRLYHEALCAMCHRIGSTGGAGGPDLTGAGGRFGVADLLEAIIEPNKTVPEQFRQTMFKLKDGNVVVGKIVNHSASRGAMIYSVNTNMMNPAQITRVSNSQIVEHKQLPHSPMPPGLIHTMTPQDVADLLTFLRSGGK